jgi:hypothetical protein
VGLHHLNLNINKVGIELNNYLNGDYENARLHTLSGKGDCNALQL